ncbi:hypothetical protein NDU88_004402, partial [Pleurodeles waltl]
RGSCCLKSQRPRCGSALFETFKSRICFCPKEFFPVKRQVQRSCLYIRGEA